MKIGPDKPVVGATLVVARPRHQPVFIPLCGLRKAMVIPNAAQPHPVIPLKIACVPPYSVIPAESLPRTPIRGRNPVSGPCGPVPTPFSSSMVPVATGMANCYENRPRQTRRRGNPCGCPFPAPTRFHPLMWPSQGHGHSERSAATPCHSERSAATPCHSERSAAK